MEERKSNMSTLPVAVWAASQGGCQEAELAGLLGLDEEFSLFDP